MKLSSKALTAATIALLATLASVQLTMAAGVVTTATWTGPTGTGTNQNWTDGANWSSTPDYPSGVGAGGIFNLSGTPGALTVNVTPTGAEPAVTVGSILLNNSSNAQMTINGGTATPAHLDAVDAGPATVTATGSSTSNGVPNTISARFILDDSVVVTVDPTLSTSSAGTLTWSGLIPSGNGGFTKEGTGLLSLTSNNKQYTGPTVFNNGRTRISFAGRPTATSSVTFNNGSQMTLIDDNSYTFGASSSTVLNLNGNGPTSGPHAAFPGVIRNDTGQIATITNNVDLQSSSTIHVQGTTASTTLSGAVSGVGGLIAGANPHDANLGTLFLTGTNSYSGDTIARAGNLTAAGASTTAFGAGNVSVESASLVFAGSVAKITIATNATNAIDDSAILSLAGGAAALTADDGYAELGAGIDETIGGLILGGTPFTTAGTYGSTASGADFQFDEFFLGSGVVRLAPGAGTPGDYNDDGIVNAADYVFWRKTVGQTSGLPNDPNVGTTIDDDQYNTWCANFGEGGPGGGGSGAVPEPVSVVLLLVALVGFAASRPRTR